jgi:hypothetical protein
MTAVAGAQEGNTLDHSCSFSMRLIVEAVRLGDDEAPARTTARHRLKCPEYGARRRNE